MASPSQKVRWASLGGPTSSVFGAQIFSFDSDLKLKSANYGLWSKSGPRPVLWLQGVVKRNKEECASAKFNGQPSLRTGGHLSGLHKGRHDS